MNENAKLKKSTNKMKYLKKSLCDAEKTIQDLEFSIEEIQENQQREVEQFIKQKLEQKYLHRFVKQKINSMDTNSTNPTNSNISSVQSKSPITFNFRKRQASLSEQSYGKDDLNVINYQEILSSLKHSPNVTINPTDYQNELQKHGIEENIFEENLMTDQSEPLSPIHRTVSTEAFDQLQESAQQYMNLSYIEEEPESSVSFVTYKKAKLQVSQTSEKLMMNAKLIENAKLKENELMGKNTSIAAIQCELDKENSLSFRPARLLDKQRPKSFCCTKNSKSNCNIY